jgi:hypothetical protein
MPDPFGASPDPDEIDIEENQNLVQVREYAKRQERRARKLERQLEELAEKLAAYEKQTKISSAEKLARELGLGEDRWQQLLEFKSEPTEDDVRKFAALVGKTPEEPKREQTVEQPQAEQPAQPQTGGTPGFVPAPGTSVPSGQVSWDEIKAAIARRDDGFLTALANKVAAGAATLDLGPYGHLVGDPFTTKD